MVPLQSTISPCISQVSTKFRNTYIHNTFLIHFPPSSMQAGCLRDRSWIDERLDHNATSLLPGQRYTADQQCKKNIFKKKSW